MAEADHVAWSVRKLQELKFHGDANALAAYVNALIENNQSSEAGDKTLLRSRTQKELEEFLGETDASTFVAALMAHLVRSQRQSEVTPARAPTATPAKAKTASQDQSAPLASSGPLASSAPLGSRKQKQAPSAPQQSHTPPAGHTSSANAGGNGRGAGRVGTRGDKSSSSGGGGGIGKTRTASQFGDAPPSLPGGGAGGGARTGQGSRAAPADGSGVWSKGRRGDPPAQSAQPIDLRQQLSRRPASSSIPSKRPRDSNEREETKSWERDDRRGVNASGGRGPRGSVRDHGRGDRFDRGDRVDRDREWDRDRDHGPDHNRDERERDRDFERNPRNGSGRPHNDQQSKRLRLDNGWRTGQGALHGGGAPPHVGMPPGMPPPGDFYKMQQMFAGGGPVPPGFPPPPGLFPPPGMVPHGGAAPFGTNGHNRGGGGGGRGQGRGVRGGASFASQPQQGQIVQGAGNHARGRMLNAVLVVRNVPAEKLNLGAINGFFKRFGSVSNIQLRPAASPDHAYVEFSRRSEAEAAHNSVDSVMGNRHIRLYWARERDYEHDGLSLAGVELAPPPGSKQHQQGSQERTAHHKQDAADPVGEEKPEDVLQRKRKEIAALREEQIKTKAAREEELKKCIAEQKNLFGKISEGVSAEQKKEILREIKALGNKADEIRARLKPKDLPAKPVSGAVSHHAQRPMGSMSLDRRPKILRISNATSEGLTEATAASVFRETLSAKLEGGDWILDFSSRRAAESAVAAVHILKKKFGAEAVVAFCEARGASAVATEGNATESAALKSSMNADTELSNNPQPMVVARTKAVPESSGEDQVAQAP